jgi:hypothetical protein
MIAAALTTHFLAPEGKLKKSIPQLIAWLALAAFTITFLGALALL